MHGIKALGLSFGKVLHARRHYVQASFFKACDDVADMAQTYFKL